MKVSDQTLDLSDLLAEINSEYRRPALVAGLTDHQRLWALGATGVRQLGNDAKVTTADPFHIGSITKPMTATVIAAMVERGLLSWTTTAAEVFPEAAGDMHPQVRDVGIISFVSHRAGLSGFTGDEDWIPFTDWQGPPAALRERFARQVLAAEPEVPSGELHYSNAAFTVAAAMAERVTRQPWEELLRSYLLTPLRMTSAGTGWPARAGSQAPVGHWEAGDTFCVDDEDGTFAPWPLVAPAGDLHMNVADLAAFARVHLLGFAGYDTVIRADSVQKLYHELGYDQRNSKQIGYLGSAGTFYAVLMLWPPRRQAIVVMTNAGDSGNTLADQIVDTLTRRIDER